MMDTTCIVPCAVCGDLTRVAYPYTNAVCLRHLKRQEPKTPEKRTVAHRLPKGSTVCPRCGQPRVEGSAYCLEHKRAQWRQWRKRQGLLAGKAI